MNLIKNIIPIIHQIVECEKQINQLYLSSIKQIYELANDNSLLTGHMRAVENIFIVLKHLVTLLKLQPLV